MIGAGSRRLHDAQGPIPLLRSPAIPAQVPGRPIRGHLRGAPRATTGKANGKQGPLLLLALDGYGPAHHLRQLTGDGQAQAHPLVLPIRAGGLLLEGIVELGDEV